MTRPWEHKIKMADNARQFIKKIFFVLFFKQNILIMIYEFQII